MDEQTYLQRISDCERSLYRVSRSILWNDMDSADAVQQAVFKGWINRRQLRSAEKFQSWIMSILINECRNLQRRKLRQANIVGALENKLKVEKNVAKNEALEEALRELPEHYRLPVVLHYMEGYSIRDIASILGITENRVTERMYRARRKLEEALKL